MSCDLEPPTLSRLNSMLAAGYRIDHATSREVANALWLDHPAKTRAQEPTLILYATGLVVSDCTRRPTKAQLRIAPDEETAFSTFIRGVPKPSIWERTSEMRMKVLVLAIFLVFAAAIWIAVDHLSR